jgi:hypothetical protein
MVSFGPFGETRLRVPGGTRRGVWADWLPERSEGAEAMLRPPRSQVLPPSAILASG